MILLGDIALWVATLVAAWSVFTSLAGGVLKRDALVVNGRRAMYAACGLVLVSSTGLVGALLTSDFSLRYVASHTSVVLPAIYKFAAFWSGQQGSLLLWALMLSFCGAIAAFASRHRSAGHGPWSTVTIAGLLVIVLALCAITANPYERLTWIPVEGRGLIPPLQNPSMVVYPPALYLGYIATAVPFAFATGALVTRRVDSVWLNAVRPWSLASWFFLTIGITLGLRWAYVEQRWDGAWTLDPVMNASVFPWLSSTAFLGSILFQEKRGLVRTWSVALVVATFLLSAIGLFIALNGVTHAEGAVARITLTNGSLAFVAAALVIAWLCTTRLTDADASAPPASGPGAGAPARAVAGTSWRYGASIALAGAVLMSSALVGTAFRKEYRVTLGAGETYVARDPWGHDWTFASQGLSRFAQLNRDVLAVALRPVRDGTAFPLIRSERRQYVDARGENTFAPATEAGILHTLRQDVFVLLARASEDRRAELRIAFNPLAMWCWWGGVLLACGGLIALWPRTTAPAEAARARAEAGDRAEALVRRVRATAITCPACGALCTESGAVYCSSCGAALPA